MTDIWGGFKTPCVNDGKGGGYRQASHGGSARPPLVDFRLAPIGVEFAHRFAGNQYINILLTPTGYPEAMNELADRPEVNSANGLNELALRRGWALLCDPSCSFTYKELDTLHALWNSKAGPRGIPKRSEMTARMLRPYMKVISIHERVAGPNGTRRNRVRLMGDVNAQVLGETQGKFYDEFLQESSVPVWNAMTDAVLGHGAPVRILMRSDEVNRSYLVGEMFNAPLLREDGSATLVLGVSYFDGNRRWEDAVAGLHRETVPA